MRKKQEQLHNLFAAGALVVMTGLFLVGLEVSYSHVEYFQGNLLELSVREANALELFVDYIVEDFSQDLQTSLTATREWLLAFR